MITAAEYKAGCSPLRQTISEYHRRAVTADPRMTKWASHVQNISTWYCYAYYFVLTQKFVADRDATVLDWGGQFGHVTSLFQTCYPNTICYNIAQHDLLEYWQKAFETRQVIQKHPEDRMSKISLGDESVDVVLSSGVLEHTWEMGVPDRLALQEMHRILRTSGLVVIWHLPTRFGFPEMMNKLLGRFYHARRYSRDEITVMMGECGFEIVKLDKHEILYPQMRQMLGRMIGQENALMFDFWLSRLPLIRIFAQHFTVVARKLPGYAFPGVSQGAC